MKQHGKHLDNKLAKILRWDQVHQDLCFGYFRAKSPDGSNLEIISSGEAARTRRSGRADCYGCSRLSYVNMGTR